MRRPVLYTAEKGKDVFADNERFRTLDSTRNQFKIFEEGLETFTLNASNNYKWEKTITHNLGYSPYVLCYGNSIQWDGDGVEDISKDSRFTPIPLGIQHYAGAMFISSVTKTSTTVKIKVYEDYTWASPYILEDMKIRYFIFIDRE